MTDQKSVEDTVPVNVRVRVTTQRMLQLRSALTGKSQSDIADIAIVRDCERYPKLMKVIESLGDEDILGP